MTPQASILLAISLMLTPAGGTPAGNEEGTPLRLPLIPPAEQVHGLPLTKVLSKVGSRVKGGYVLFGVEVALRGGKEPTISLSDKGGADLGTALREILSQIPDYEMHVISAHLIEILPRRARTDPKDLLNLRIATFSVTNTPAASILAHPARFIPELQARLKPRAALGTRPVQVYSGPFALSGSEVTLHLQNVSVRQILDAVSEATGSLGTGQQRFGWACKLRSDDTKGVPKHTWQALPGR